MKSLKSLILILLTLAYNTSNAQQSEKEIVQMLMNAASNQSINIGIPVSVNEAITIEGLENLKIIGDGKAELRSFNNIPHLIKFKNCKDVNIQGVKMRYGVNNVGGPILIFENCNEVLLDGLELGNYANHAIFIDSLSKDIKIFNSKISGCHESGMKINSGLVEIQDNEFSDNSAIGRFKPDLNVEVKKGYPLVRYNSYRVADYVKHKTTVDEYVESRNSLSYNFDCFKIVKKYELPNGAEGKLTAFYEGENNKVLDKMESDYKGPKGQITATVYFLHGNAVYTSYEIRKGKVEINYLVYGDFLDHLEKADSKSAAHVAGTPESNKEQYDKWLDVIESWKLYINDEAEDFVLYDKKSQFLPLPY